MTRVLKAPKRRAQRRRGVTWAAVIKLATRLPGVEVGTSYGTPGLRVAGKFLGRLRDEDGLLVLKVGSMEERDLLLKVDPAVFHITEHYRDYPSVLVRLEAATPGLIAGMLEDSWRRAAPRKLVAAHDKQRAARGQS